MTDPSKSMTNKEARLCLENPHFESGEYDALVSKESVNFEDCDGDKG